MKIGLPIASLIGGFALGYFLFDHFQWAISADYAPYLSVAALAGLDTVFGGIRAGIEGRFQNDIFASGFLLNTPARHRDYVVWRAYRALIWRWLP